MLVQSLRASVRVLLNFCIYIANYRSALRSPALRDSKLQAWSPSALSSHPQLSVKVCDPISFALLKPRAFSFYPDFPPPTYKARTPTNISTPADLIQDLYLKELKAYKAPTVKASDSEGHVLKFSAPKPPQSPEETDIANELKAYEASAVEIEGQAEGGAAVQEEDWFEEEPEEEAAHH